MDRSDARFLRSKSSATETQRVLTRRSLLAGAGGFAVLATTRRGFAGSPADLTERRNGTMDIKRNGSRPSGKGPEAWFTGTVRVDPITDWSRARTPRRKLHQVPRTTPETSYQ
jgi:hypothetical protein